MPIRNYFQSRERKALGLLFVAVLAIWGWALWPRPPVLAVTFPSAGQGDAAVLRTPDGHTVLIDAGPGPTEQSDFDAGSKIVVPFLKHEGVNFVDALIVTHPHEDHAGGADSILRTFKVGTIIVTGVGHTTGVYRKLFEDADRRSVPLREVRRGQIINLGDGVTAEVLNPPAGDNPGDDIPGLNDTSVVLRVSYGEVNMLLSGDADKDAEVDMLAQCPRLQAQVLKVAHHGSSKATTTEWLAAVRPEVAIISVGHNNPFGHPSTDTLKRLEDSGAHVYRTDEDGGVTVTTDGHRVNVQTSRHP